MQQMLRETFHAVLASSGAMPRLRLPSLAAFADPQWVRHESMITMLTVIG